MLTVERDWSESVAEFHPFAHSPPALYNKSFTHIAGESRDIYDSFSRT